MMFRAVVIAALLFLSATGCACWGPHAQHRVYRGCAETPSKGCGDPGCGNCDSCAESWHEYTIGARTHKALTCGAGCGERYWGEWCYDPPKTCDPCDCYGNYVGPQPCRPPFWKRFWMGLHGSRHCDSCCGPCSGGCGAGYGFDHGVGYGPHGSPIPAPAPSMESDPGNGMPPAELSPAEGIPSELSPPPSAPDNVPAGPNLSPVPTSPPQS